MTDHYFSQEPNKKSDVAKIDVVLPDLRMELIVDSGVFASKGFDRGTKVLLSRIDPIMEDGNLLDIGCGYGPIALTLAQRHPDSKVWAVDVNKRALELTKTNAKKLGVRNIVACTPDEVPSDTVFEGIYSNPPIRIGKPALHELLLHWLPRLAPNAYAYLVVHKHLGSDSLAKWLGEQGYVVERMRSSGGYRILSAGRPQGD